MRQISKKIGLAEKQLARLSALAIEHQTLSRGGITTGQPSWRCLVASIGDGTLVVSAPGAKGERRKKKERKPWKAHSQYPPRWWTPSNEETMTVDDAVAASGKTLEQLLAGGMLMPPTGGTKIYGPKNCGDKWFSKEVLE